MNEPSLPKHSTLRVWIDFVCPYCMLATKPLHTAVAGLPIRIDWMPLELRPEPAPQFRGDEPFIRDGWQRSIYPLARQLGIEMSFPPVSPQPYTRLAFEGLQFAKHVGKGQEYGDAVFRAFFQRGENIGEIDVLTNVAANVGLAAAEFRDALRTGTYREAHASALKITRQLGISAVPTIMLRGQPFSGVPDATALRRALEALLQSGGDLG